MKYWYFFLSLCIPISSTSQPVLSLNQAVGMALQQNFDIQISELEQKAEAMQVYRSNAGMGPVIDWNLGFSGSGNSVNQKFTDGRIINRWGRAFSPSTDISLDLTLYDGGRMKATYNRLGLLSQYSTAQGKLIIQNTIVEVMLAYYEIRKQRETVDYLNSIIKYYKERLKITEERWKVGKGSKIDFLQSQIDLNAQLSELSRADNNLQNAKVVLNGLLNRDPSESFDTEDTPRTNRDYQFADLADQAKNRNRDILLLQKMLQIRLEQEAELEADLKPTVALSGSVGYSYNNTNAGFLLSNQTLFARAGLSARWNLYDGRHRKNQLEISKINTEIVSKQQESLETQIMNDLTIAYNQYDADKKLLEFEELNKSIAEENLSISLEKFRLGGSSILELNEAQRAYDTALNRLVTAQYNIKISELDLLLLSGDLVN